MVTSLQIWFARMYGLKLLRIGGKVGLGFLLLLVVFFISRIYESERGPDLHPWQTWVGHEMTVKEIDAASFQAYLLRENAIFSDMQTQMSKKISDADKIPLNRYYSQSSVYPARFHQNWNRSFVLMPTGKPRGAVVLLHGLTDSPYSVRSLAEDYRQQGFVAIAPRLPGHGTTPGSLTAVNWEQWMAVTRLSVREATRLTGQNLPLHIVGYSNGGALALKYALDCLDDKSLRLPQQIVLVSPMIGVTAFARFAGLASWPAVFPAFAKAAWLTITPEFNPFKYNSFPVQAARQSWSLTRSLQKQIVQSARRQQLAALPPMLTFQSVMDSTVSTRAVIDSLYRYLNNGSELVLFDINQVGNLRPLFKPSAYSAVSRILPPAPRAYRATVITNAAPNTEQTVAMTTLAGDTGATIQPLQIAWPQGMYSLSHIALPFPLSDDLYGLQPSDKHRYGISLGTLSLRGETSTLTVGLDTLLRVTSNPFFPYMLQRINHSIACSARADIQACVKL